MRVRFWFAAIVLMLTDVAVAKAQTEPFSYDPTVVVARVGNAHITLGQIGEMIELRRMFRSSALEDQKRRIRLLDDIIDDSLISLEASRVSLKGQHGALARVRRGVTLSAANIFLQEYAARMLQLDSATIDTFYQNHITRYSTPHDQRRARIITVWKEGGAPGLDSVRFRDSVYAGWYPEDKIDSLYIRLANGEPFDDLVMKHSEDPLTRGKGGDIGWVSKRSLGPGPLTERVFNSPLYMYSKPFETDAGWHIVQVTGERLAGPVPLDAEITKEIISHLVEQQKNLILKELGDSIQAIAPVEWNEKSRKLRHDDLRNDMVLVIVNHRDTMYAEEYLQEALRWIDRASNLYPEPEAREEIIRGEYIRLLCWYDFLRQKGYLDLPEIQEVRARNLHAERVAIVQSRIASATVPEPDSTDIINYYKDSIHLYGDAPNALSFAWNSIATKLRNDAKDAVWDRWRREASARHKVWRDDDALIQVPLLAHKPRRK